MQVRVQDRQHQPEVDGHGRLPGEQLLDPLLDLEMACVDVVVEADDLVGKHAVPAVERRERGAEGT